VRAPLRSPGGTTAPSPLSAYRGRELPEATLNPEIPGFWPNCPFPVHRFSIYSERITVECLLGCWV